MKILTINLPHIPHETISITQDVMRNTTPFGYDVIICDPATLATVTLGDSSQDHLSIGSKWRQYLKKWLDRGNLLIVLLEPFRQAEAGYNYLWQPVNFPAGNLSDEGINSDYIGDVVANEYILKNFLTENKFQVKSYLHVGDYQNIIPLSKIDEETYTAFTTKEYPNAIFLPKPLNINSLIDLVVNILSSESMFEIEKSRILKEQVSKIDEKIKILEENKSQVLKDLADSQSLVKQLIVTDVYLSRAIKLHSKISTSENPDPEDYYEAIENIETAFGSEHKMRAELDISKGFYGQLMKRTNDFRHAQESGNEPTALTVQEQSDFREKVETIIKKYIEYLYLKKILG